VAIRWLDKPTPDRRAAEVASAVSRALAEDAGDVLVFLPGAREIRQIGELLAERVGKGVALLPLHGDLPLAAQDAALAPSPLRKVVLSTAIAETSLTIEGVRIVVDCAIGGPRASIRAPGSRTS
jgi:ATP-dependent helicase HrpB